MGISGVYNTISTHPNALCNLRSCASARTTRLILTLFFLLTSWIFFSLFASSSSLSLSEDEEEEEEEEDESESESELDEESSLLELLSPLK